MQDLTPDRLQTPSVANLWGREIVGRLASGFDAMKETPLFDIADPMKLYAGVKDVVKDIQGIGEAKEMTRRNERNAQAADVARRQVKEGKRASMPEMVGSEAKGNKSKWEGLKRGADIGSRTMFYTGLLAPMVQGLIDGRGKAPSPSNREAPESSRQRTLSIDKFEEKTGVNMSGRPQEKIFPGNTTNDSSVGYWKKHIRAGERPRVRIGMNGDQTVVIDGNNRLEAYRALGIRDIPVDVDPGVPPRFSPEQVIGENTAHGAQRVRDIRDLMADYTRSGRDIPAELTKEYADALNEARQFPGPGAMSADEKNKYVRWLVQQRASPKAPFNDTFVREVSEYVKAETGLEFVDYSGLKRGIGRFLGGPTDVVSQMDLAEYFKDSLNVDALRAEEMAKGVFNALGLR